ncbi:hypothetical protein Xtri_05255 [Xanthomonas campestris pv. trichodesmae]|uniref:Uncharacterized protein n=1 Tax=Xanthomonas citri pv. sesbaniae TaxID=473425 RepID=A0AAW4RRR1_XANCI|nr:hypothetical protein [Xanthomonas campestris pv. trichodesmae]MBZ3925578.1 hypothetical protein [Xanthomonas citri pv. sesbaniae]
MPLAGSELEVVSLAALFQTADFVALFFALALRTLALFAVFALVRPVVVIVRVLGYGDRSPTP